MGVWNTLVTTLSPGSPLERIPGRQRLPEGVVEGDDSNLYHQTPGV